MGPKLLETEQMRPSTSWSPGRSSVRCRVYLSLDVVQDRRCTSHDRSKGPCERLPTLGGRPSPAVSNITRYLIDFRTTLNITQHTIGNSNPSVIMDGQISTGTPPPPCAVRMESSLPLPSSMLKPVKLQPRFVRNIKTGGATQSGQYPATAAGLMQDMLREMERRNTIVEE